ncbi:SDR family oxidoreductase [Nocardia sp. NPDC004568]|uniref:SDR family oxidoreductase n=1 Tax=Nocardia sp. NPDC004568 TaxID=3154551 RepID=UPI0033A60D72
MTADTTAAERVVIIGGSSGMGLALARELVGTGAEVVIAGRSATRLATASATLPTEPGAVHTRQVDITRESAVETLFADLGRIDHAIVTAADVRGMHAPIRSFEPAATRALVETKLFGPALVAKYADFSPGGSLVLTSGIAAHRPGPGAALVAAVNGGVASLAYALALELAPTRVNVISPGWVDIPIWESIGGGDPVRRQRDMAARLPVGRIGRPDDIAAAILALMRNPFVTGTVLHADGGHRLV